MIFDTISMGTPERDAKVAEWRRKSWGRKWIPTAWPAFITIIRAASYEIGNMRSFGFSQTDLAYSRNLSATFTGINTYSYSRPLFGSRSVSF
jgi:hypothetical protein